MRRSADVAGVNSRIDGGVKGSSLAVLICDCGGNDSGRFRIGAERVISPADEESL